MVEWVRQFFYDQIHMTQGERLFEYWYVWLSLLIGVYIVLRLKVKKK